MPIRVTADTRAAELEHCQEWRARLVAELASVDAVIAGLDHDDSAPADYGLLTVADMAAILGVTPRRVRALAARRQVGWKAGRGVWVFRQHDVERLRPGPAGRPRMQEKAVPHPIQSPLR